MRPPAQLPPAVGPGDSVGIAALSGPVDPERLERGVAALERLGFKTVLARNLSRRAGLFAGTSSERLGGFHELVADRRLGAIFFARGGHGLLRVLPGIDWDLLARFPRAYVGYSDLTPLLLGIVARFGWVAFHGPLVAGEFARGMSGEEERVLLDALAGSFPATLPLAAPLRPGSATGPLLGGCLSLLTATVGTPYLPSLAGSMLFFEDVNEPFYKVDRMLTHLGLSGNLAAIAGMIVGHLEGGEHAANVLASRDDAAVSSERWRALIAENLSDFSWPVAWGLAAGHAAPNFTLPLGMMARIDEQRLHLG
jgi:muramoyltetrapeptide carboxypeptidase